MVALPFCPQIFGGGRNVQIMVCLKKNAAWVVRTIIGGGDMFIRTFVSSNLLIYCWLIRVS